MKRTKKQARKRIQQRLRKKISGTAVAPRLAVFRSNKEIYCQLIDDVKGHTICAASSVEGSISKDGNKSDVAKQVGQLIAKKAQSENIDQVLFDRGGYLYHGRVKALADGAREGGLKF